MSDLIDRQAAIDALKRAEAITRAFGYHNVIDVIRELPSAEPEIIRCKDCRHNGSFDTDCPIDWKCKEYCSFAER